MNDSFSHVIPLSCKTFIFSPDSFLRPCSAVAQVLVCSTFIFMPALSAVLTSCSLGLLNSSKNKSLGEVKSRPRGRGPPQGRKPLLAPQPRRRKHRAPAEPQGTS